MAERPKKLSIKGASGGLILRKIIEEDKSGFLAGAPIETQTTAGFMSAARYILASENRMNATVRALQNRFFIVVMQTMAFYSDWERYTEKGILEEGEGIEEIYVGLCDPEQYVWTTDINATMKALFGKREQEVATAFHAINFQKRYTVTVSEDELRKALRSPGQLQRFVKEKSDGAVKSYLYDNYLLNKYMLYRLALDGKIYNLTVPALERSTASDAAIRIRALIEDATHLRSTYTISKLPQSMDREKAIVARTALFAAYIDVDVLAQAFNMQKAEYARRQLSIDGFNKADVNRLNLLMESDNTYVPFTEDELTIINENIYAFVFDEDFFQNYTFKMRNDGYVYNEAESYSNSFLHIWKQNGVSPFKSVIMVSSETGEITEIVITPADFNMYPGTTIQLTAAVTKTGIVDGAVTWEVDVDPSVAYVMVDGTLHVTKDATAGTTITITATSVANPEVTATTTVTVTT